jgi:glycosyltransferase involved in cell wall biosynthesis
VKTILLVSDKVMHYRVSIYNYFLGRFDAEGYRLVVRADRLQKANPYPVKFDFKEVPFRFSLYRREILDIRPSAVILFLHLKDLLIFPLVHWLKWRGIPAIFWTKGANLDDPGSRLRRLLFHHVQRLSTGIVLYSPKELGFVAKRSRGKVTYANNTVNYHDYPAITDIPEDIKKEFGIPFRKVALFVGRMDEGLRGRKKADHAIEVFRRLENPDYGLVLVGSGLSPELRKTMNPKNTLYLGEVHDPRNILISKLFRMADVFLMPGHVGLSLNQAFFWGLPVVTEAGNQPPEIHCLVDGRNGYMVPEGDLDALTRRVVHLLDDDGERLRLGENARSDLLKNASIEGMFEGFLANIRRIEAGRRPR